jgi:dTMP kinase
MKKGLFIVLDGNDGSGKATQSKLLAEQLERESISCVKMDFPSYTRNFFGAFVGECLAGQHGDFLHMDPKIASVLYATDRMESSASIRKTLEEGGIVIADRFSSSNQIHQGGKISKEQDRVGFLKWLDRMEHDVLNIPRPDLIIYLRVPVEISLKLLLEKRAIKNTHLAENAKDTVEEDRTYLERSHETANWLAERQPNWRVIICQDAQGSMRSIEDIHSEIRKIVGEALRS